MSATVGDLMTSPVITVTPATGFQEVARLLRDNGFSAVPVVDADGRVIGVVSEADLLFKTDRELAHAATIRTWSRRESLRKAAGTIAFDIMSSPAVTVLPEVSAAEAAWKMHTCGMQRLPVVDGRGRLIGIVTRGDLLSVFLRRDDDIQHEVLTDLDSSGFPTDRVDVTVQGGVVVIEGELGDPARARQAEEIAGRVDGVVAVRTSAERTHSEGDLR